MIYLSLNSIQAGTTKRAAAAAAANAAGGQPLVVAFSGQLEPSEPERMNEGTKERRSEGTNEWMNGAILPIKEPPKWKVLHFKVEPRTKVDCPLRAHGIRPSCFRRLVS